MIDADELRRWLADRSGLLPCDIADATPIFSSNLLNSIDLVELVDFIEQATGRRLRPLDFDFRNFDSILAIRSFADSLDRA